jgi:hypothetical protein
LTSGFICEELNRAWSVSRVGIACHWIGAAGGLRIEVSTRNNVWDIRIYSADGQTELAGSRAIRDACPFTGDYQMAGVCDGQAAEGIATLL